MTASKLAAALALRANLPQKLSNESNAILLCMGLFSTFLSGSRS
ncbi:hypothetical protein ABIB73_004339 [Bradyrhizobium sp. F1.4.3]